MEKLRTPDERFENLVDWPFEPRYVNIDGELRVHYIDDATGASELLFHGDRPWGNRYRKMIPTLVNSGCRVIVPDLVGFSTTDKPEMRDDNTYRRHLP